MTDLRQSIAATSPLTVAAAVARHQAAEAAEPSSWRARARASREGREGDGRAEETEERERREWERQGRRYGASDRPFRSAFPSAGEPGSPTIRLPDSGIVISASPERWAAEERAASRGGGGGDLAVWRRRSHSRSPVPSRSPSPTVTRVLAAERERERGEAAAAAEQAARQAEYEAARAEVRRLHPPPLGSPPGTPHSCSQPPLHYVRPSCE